MTLNTFASTFERCLRRNHSGSDWLEDGADFLREMIVIMEKARLTVPVPIRKLEESVRTVVDEVRDAENEERSR